MKRFLFSTLFVSLFTFSSFPQCGGGTPIIRYVVCACDGSEDAGGACRGFTGKCQYNFPGDFCGFDGIGNPCYIATASGCSASASRASAQPLTRVSKGNQLAQTASIRTCGQTEFEHLQVVTWGSKSVTR